MTFFFQGGFRNRESPSLHAAISCVSITAEAKLALIQLDTLRSADGVEGLSSFLEAIARLPLKSDASADKETPVESFAGVWVRGRFNRGAGGPGEVAIP